MPTHRLGIIMHGITGRMGYNQHLVRSICAIRDQGGVLLSNGDRVMPDPVLVGRNAERVAAIAKKHGIARTATSVETALANKDDTVFFNSGSTQMRVGLLRKAIAASKHVYCEKPVSETLAEALSVAQAAHDKGVKSRRGAGQAVPARAAQDQDASRFRFLRPHPLGARRVRLLGVRRRLGPAGAAAELELPQEGRRRHHPRHAATLALRAR